MRLLPGLLVILLAFATAAFGETRIIELRHRRAAEVVDAVRTALGPDATVTAIDRSLVVNATPAQLAVVAELLARLDRPARMVRVWVTQDQRESDRAHSAEGSLRVSAGDTGGVGGSRSPELSARSGGATVLLGGDHVQVAGSVSAGSRADTRRADQFLTALEGSPARITVGQRLPFAERWLTLARRHATVAESVRYESLDTGFEVVTTLFAEEQAELAIHPFMAFLEPGGGREIRFSDLSTTVRVRLGEWLDLGGTMAGRDEVSRQILGLGERSGEKSGGVRIRVEALP